MVERLALSRAKHRSLAGHPRIALGLSRCVPDYQLDESHALRIDGAPPAVRERRAKGLAALESRLRALAPRTLAATRELSDGLSDAQLVARNRVPFPFRELALKRLPVGTVVSASEGVRLRDLDGNWHYDLAGSYGVNLFGEAIYKHCIERAVERARPLGLVLGPYHPVVTDNVARLRAVSGLDEVSFHMSGTEAVMQAVRLARYHTGKTHAVRFAGAYHGWWDGIQAGPGNPLPAERVHTLEEGAEAALRVLRSREDIACVLVNPLQALTPNRVPPVDSALLGAPRIAQFDKAAYTQWLKKLRAVCDERGIALIFDEVFLGFRLARGGAQEFFGVRADLVTYGKTLGGGLPVGVVCGQRRWMRRFRADAPADLCFARGTFNAHPYVMAAMNEMLRHIDSEAARDTWRGLETRWSDRAVRWNAALENAGVPVRVANLTSVFTTNFLAPGRFHWLLQFYARAEGLALPWTGTGRFIFPHNVSEADFEEIVRRFVWAARAMARDGFFWRRSGLASRAARALARGEELGVVAHAVLRRALHAVPTPAREAPRGAETVDLQGRGTAAEHHSKDARDGGLAEAAE
jgi:glutamate-1-semialdehyde 2,1-aminomutase